MSFLVAWFFLVLVLLFDWWWGRRTKNLPPKFPGSLPFLGHAHLLVGDGKYLWKFIREVQLHCHLIGGISYIRLGPQIHYIICNPEDYMKVMDTCLEKNYWYGKILKTWVGEGLVTASVPVWKRHHKLLGPSFTQRVADGCIDIHNKQAKVLLTRLSGLVNKPFEPLNYIEQSAMEANFQAVFGIELDDNTESQMETYIKAFGEIKQVMTRRIQNIWMHNDLIYSYTQLKKRQDEALRITRGLSDEIIKRKRAAMKIKGPSDQNMEEKDKRFRGFMERILDLSDDGVLSDEEIRWQVDSMILAGYDTSSTTTTIACMMLGSYPEVQEKVYQELLDVFGESDRDVEKEDLSKLVYLDAVLKEVGRLYPAAPVITRYVDKDVKLKDFTMPAGSNCAILISGVNRHKVWGADSHEFRPDRWLDPASLPNNANAFTGFSTGRRACLGKPYAVNLIKITLVHLVRRFRIKADHSKMTMQLQIFLKPTEGCFVTLESRSDTM